MVKKYRQFSQDLRKKFLLIGMVPIVIISLFLFGKIYFIIDDVSEQSHSKILRDIDFYTDQLLLRVSKKAMFLEENFKDLDLKKFLLANNDIDTLIIYDKKDGSVVKLVSDLYMTQKDKDDYIKNNPYSQYKDITKPTYNTIHKSINKKSTTISYAIPTKDYIFVYDINLSTVEAFIKYIKKSVDYIIVVVDKDGNYIYNTSDYKYFKDNFFNTEYYQKIVQVNEPLQYEEFYNEEQGEDNFVVYYKSHDTGWTIVTIEDSDTLDDKVLSLIPFVVILIPVLLIAIFIISKQFTQKIVSPLELLIEKMEKLSKNDSLEKIEIENLEYSLFKRMIDSFNNMQELIYKREEELKHSNEELINKTEEITLLNSGLEQKIEEEIEKNRKKINRCSNNQDLLKWVR